MARRKKTRSKRSRKLNVNLVDTASALLLGGSIIDSANFVGSGFNASPEFRAGMWSEGLSQVSRNLQNRNVQKRLVGIGLGAVALKGVSKALRVRKIGGIGPLNINI